MLPVPALPRFAASALAAIALSALSAAASADDAPAAQPAAGSTPEISPAEPAGDTPAAAQPAGSSPEIAPAPAAQPAGASPDLAPAAAIARDAPAPPPDLWAHVTRPWLYSIDPSAPPPGHVITALSVGYAATDLDSSRPFAGNISSAGAVFSVAAEVGILRFLSLKAEGLLAGQGSSKKVSGGAMIGPNFYLLRPGAPVNIALSAGYLRELGGDNGVWARAAIAGDLGQARLVLTALGEHVFTKDAPGAKERDAIDLVITAGASYALTQTFRLGAEYVVQDLEGAWDPEEAEGGIRHFLGPVAALELARHVQISAGPAFGLSKGAPHLLGRLSAMYAF